MTIVPRRLMRFAVVVASLLYSHASLAAQDKAFDVAVKMGRGINILGYDGLWDGGTDAPFRFGNLETIRNAGFRHVRINLVAFRFLDRDNRLDPTFLERLDNVIERVIAHDLIPVIDEHDYDFCQREPANCAVKLKAFWLQLSLRYVSRFPSLVFEILNEPGGRMTPAFWNTLASEVLFLIRAANPDRTVIVAPINIEDVTRLSEFRIPRDDRNLILTVHYYAPFEFTHQGAPWSPRLAKRFGLKWGSEADKKKLTDDFEAIDAWAKSEGRPLYLGEFGVYERAAPEQRAAYLSFVTRTADRLGWSWAYWQFDHDFAAFDTARQNWIAPVIDALIPKP
jgi:endoglucanase